MLAGMAALEVHFQFIPDGSLAQILRRKHIG